MAGLTRRITISQNERLTPEKLHNLIEKSGLIDLANSDLQGDIDMVNFSGPPTTLGDNYEDLTGKLEFFFGAASREVGRDPLKAGFLINRSGITVTKGMVLVADPNNDASVKITSSPVLDTRVVGPVDDASVVDGAATFIVIRGVALVNVFQDTLARSAGSFLTGPVNSGTTAQKTAARIKADPNSPATYGGSAFAVLLEPTAAGFGVVNQYWAMVFK